MTYLKLPHIFFVEQIQYYRLQTVALKDCQDNIEFFLFHADKLIINLIKYTVCIIIDERQKIHMQ